MNEKDYLYLDYASTTPLNEEVFNLYTELLNKYFANSDSLHDLGLEVKNLHEKARLQIARSLMVDASEVIFTSGASEANNMAIKGVAWANRHKGKHIITTMIEHSSVLNSVKQLESEFGFDVTYLSVDENGQVTLDMVKQSLRDDTILVSIMMVNNEIGSVNPISEIAEYVKLNTKAYLHVDAVQALGKLAIDLGNIDLASFSMHKIYGLKGSGILVKKRHVNILSLISAGQQENSLRGGTSNYCVNIVAAKTIRLALIAQKQNLIKVRSLNDELSKRLRVIDKLIINSPSNASPFIINISYPTIKSEIMMNALNQRKIAVSAQSTCHSKSKEISHVYQALGYQEDRAESAIRISLSSLVDINDIERFTNELKEIIRIYG
ncbi:MAG: cysteine desulfurase family protein [Erysipelotrichaceae bacterium]|nr:cysteine desulfurase family protein [Erysipelotrichaceae bacterium]MDD4643113.1 cysteine desulfurase family protein [Erysipelotrichaceae bacterium]